jgi:hypothetical protein
VLLLAPDLSALGYLGGRRVGAAAYNAFHTYAGPALGWTGRAFGTRAAHAWTLTPRAGGVLVETEESLEGWLPRLLRGMMRRTLEESINVWLASLERKAEGGA